MKNRFSVIRDMQLDTDYLTGLLNRRGLNDVWNALPSTFELHCVYLDIDNFKLVNDVYGHSKGDELLIFVADMLEDVFKDQLVVRMGGDEFCILCNGDIDKSDIEEKFPKLQTRLAEEDFEGSIDNVLSFSMGVLYNQPVAAGLNTILLKCDDAMYYMKKHGKNGVVNYDSISTMIEERKAIKSRAKYAMENDEISILLNPIMFLQTSEVYAAEVVLEWKFPSLGILSEERFLPVFEQYGVIRQMNAIMFEKVCEWKDSWKGTTFESLAIYVKLSASFILQKSGVDFIKDCLERYQVNPFDISIGVEESQFLESRAKMMDTVKKLKDLGLKIAINNFGSASSIKVLQDSASRILKLDSKLLDAAEESMAGQLILRNVISLGRDLYCTIIASGVTTSSRIAMLANYGAQVGVGDFYGHPLREIDFRYRYQSMLLSGRNIIPVSFSFDHTLEDDGKEYVGEVIANAPEYVKGVTDEQWALHFKGGKIRQNVVKLPKEIMYSDSYSICF
ncbi:MAG: EAL domain-containing protein, partial [Lachnospiraceae bacterium]|nr:EAL domain-containing protein [Lachnospiraceae bacterium]